MIEYRFGFSISSTIFSLVNIFKFGVLFNIIWFWSCWKKLRLDFMILFFMLTTPAAAAFTSKLETSRDWIWRALAGCCLKLADYLVELVWSFGNGFWSSWKLVYFSSFVFYCWASIFKSNFFIGDKRILASSWCWSRAFYMFRGSLVSLMTCLSVW